MRRSWLVCAVVAGLLAGCGSEPELQLAGGSDLRQIETTVTGWLTGVADGDGPAACRHLTDDARDKVREEVDAESCEQAFERVSAALVREHRQAMQQTRVARAWTRGDTAEAELESDPRFADPARNDPLPLEKVDGTWKVAGFTSGQFSGNPLGQCIVGGMKGFEEGNVHAFWKREGRADFRDYITQVCRRAQELGLDIDDPADRARSKRIAGRVILRMLERGQIRDPR